MTLNSREELHQLIEKLPESKVEKVLNIVKQEQENNTSEKFIYDNLLDGIDEIMDKHDGLLKRLAQ
ncbi:MAG: hypothetical protein KA174_10505 [Chitinophagales bacterium]|nr:hypothetical protein [Saprospirales bacterium]MBK8352205.1 hypothetical protein [Saprospirales bacterium]MBP6661106.1 hypothetical protein [Chitinophagales bacterium]HUM52353.1 hypothetical protein [Chitinophagales bacterium]